MFFDTDLHNKAWDIFLDKHALKLGDDEKNQKIHGKNNAEILSNLFSNDLTVNDIKRPRGVYIVGPKAKTKKGIKVWQPLSHI
ncbi:hypothetical protein [Flagellimonas sp. CMM7]|uniref:hypothetical protein n=1 Tax=Flagellimonas sp. CMM7 TaxID=2654676 RepID=UPI0013D699FA|nr:hypothetical protein [Flagellimonas sp. CMM7]UII81232.1 hypothetical protein LV704_06870 [Flagellimonas sp. CMM7]